ncbi:MAG: diaminopimelate epimerase [Clostridiales bacterium]|nr:diaminopimelate epimerase [Clostridiales bacterium]
MLIKMHGTENTFYLLDLQELHMTDEEKKALTIDLCHDGSDGVLFVCDSEMHIAKMRIFNADGSEPEMCGNGLRCVARYVLEKYDIDEAVIETLKTSYEVKFVDDFHGIKGISIKMYPVKALGQEELESFNKAYEFTFKYYNVSNPHVVAIKDDIIEDGLLKEIGTKANGHFKEGMNVNILTILGEDKIYVRTYERGVGITKSCGTGMTSSSVHYAIMTHAFDHPIEVYNDGGMIECLVKKEPSDYTVIFTGNATYLSNHEMDGTVIDTYDEQKRYKEFYNETRKSIPK